MKTVSYFCYDEIGWFVLRWGYEQENGVVMKSFDSGREGERTFDIRLKLYSHQLLNFKDQPVQIGNNKKILDTYIQVMKGISWRWEELETE